MSPEFEVRDTSVADAEPLRELAHKSPWAPLRYLSMFGHEVAGEVLADQVAVATEGPGVHLTTTAPGSPSVEAQVSVVPVPDLEAHFGMPFHEAGTLLSRAEGTDRREAVEAMLDRALSRLDAPGAPGVVMCRVEADDVQGLLGAEAAGFRVLETTVTFVNDLLRADRNPAPPDVEVRVVRPGTDPVDPELFGPLRGQPSQVSDSHYHRDPRLPDDRCDALYERLFERALDGVGADVVVMRMHESRIASLGSWRHWGELEPYGVSMAGSAFGFRASWAPPGNQAVVSRVTGEPITGNRLLEWSTQASNLPMVNMICRQPSMRLCRTSYVLHCWTDRRWE
jgi:hypothetical protein